MKYKEIRTCPRCHRQFEDLPMLSRKDNKTAICTECAQLEILKVFWRWRV